MKDFSSNREAMDWVDKHAHPESLVSVKVGGSHVTMNPKRRPSANALEPRNKYGRIGHNVAYPDSGHISRDKSGQDSHLLGFGKAGGHAGYGK